MEKKRSKINEEQFITTKDGKEKKRWQKPRLEDVSGKVMAQPYIRFT